MSAIFVERLPRCEPVSLTDAKNHLHVTTTDEDDQITGLIQAAREHCETFTRRSFINKGFVQTLDSFPYYIDTIGSQKAFPPAYYSIPRFATTLWNYSQMIKLYYSPLRSVDHIMYVSSADGRAKAMVPGDPDWRPLVDVPEGAAVRDSNGNKQVCTTAGVTGKTEPTWNQVNGQTTADGTVVWTFQGAVAVVGEFVQDTASRPPRVFPLPGATWPPVMYTPNAVEVHFVAGENDEAAIAAKLAAWVAGQSPVPNQAAKDAQEFIYRRADVPQTIITAMKMLIAHWYDNRWGVMADNLKTVPKGLDNLLWGERVLDEAPTQG
jgi:hypothetical protein